MTQSKSINERMVDVPKIEKGGKNESASARVDMRKEEFTTRER